MPARDWFCSWVIGDMSIQGKIKAAQLLMALADRRRYHAHSPDRARPVWGCGSGARHHPRRHRPLLPLQPPELCTALDGGRRWHGLGRRPRCGCSEQQPLRCRLLGSWPSGSWPPGFWPAGLPRHVIKAWAALGTGFHRQIRKQLQQLPIKRQQPAIQLPCQYDEFGVIRGAARRNG